MTLLKGINLYFINHAGRKDVINTKATHANMDAVLMFCRRIFSRFVIKLDLINDAQETMENFRVDFCSSSSCVGSFEILD